MSEILFHYEKIAPTTWVYVSSLLLISIFFKFNRFWSVRNLDLILLILLAPGLLMVNESRQARTAVKPAAAKVAAAIPLPSAQAQAEQNSLRQTEYFGYLWLFGVSALWLVRLLLDPTMVRRPLLEP